MSILTNASRTFLEKYLNNASPTGFEAEGQKLWLSYIKPYIHDWKIDNYGSVYGIINPDAPYRVVIEGHADEIGWYVGYIADDGFLSVVKNGGSDHLIAPSKRVNIHTKNNGVVKGIFGWPAIHVRRGDKANLSPTPENIFVDIGAKDKEEVLKMGINIGSVMTFDDEYMTLNNDRWIVGRALDNRLGGFIIAEVARLIHENNITLPFGLYVVNAVQEEIGLRGAEMIAQTIQPHCAIITDVTHDTHTPLMSPKNLGDVKCGKGPSLTVAPAVHNKLFDLITTTAQEKEIPYQLEASSRSTGTDTDAFAYSNGGVPSALISIPLRYMHTTVEMASVEDVENVIRLIYESLQRIEANHNFKYF